MKKDKWSAVKEILFTYLAINKIMYWYTTIMTLNQSDLDGVGQAVLMRLLNQDLVVIMGIVMFFYLDKFISQKQSKSNNTLSIIAFYGIGYVAFLTLQVVYSWVMSWFFPIEWYSIVSYIPQITLGYIIVAVVLNLKYYFKSKEASVYAVSAPSTEEKLAMLQVLLDDGTLSQEEFDQKKLLYM